MGCLAFMGLDGFFYDIFCDASGAHVDTHFMNKSGSNERLALSQVNNPEQYVGYTDKVTPQTRTRNFFMYNIQHITKSYICRASAINHMYGPRIKDVI
jgi:hypothetical protein